MEWLDAALDELERKPLVGYAPGQRPATEPTALAALALQEHGRDAAAREAANWLLRQQAADGSLGVREGEPEPRWPTALAVLAWRRVAQAEDRELSTAIVNARRWILGAQGKTSPRNDEVEHDTTLVAWPWVEGTHSWLEPTAMMILALRALGDGRHERTREGLRVLEDRLLPDGGCNYGNTVVLGQVLRPHVLPTGLVLAALAGRDDPSGRIVKSIQYLRANLSGRTSTLSLAWGVVGLAAQRAPTGDEPEWLAEATERARRGEVDHWRLTLVAFAALGARALSDSLVENSIPAKGA